MRENLARKRIMVECQRRGMEVLKMHLDVLGNGHITCGRQGSMKGETYCDQSL